MTTPTLRGPAALLVLCVYLAFPRPAAAQQISGDEIDRAYRPGAYVPADGMPFSHRYNYYTGPAFYLGGSGRPSNVTCTRPSRRRALSPSPRTISTSIPRSAAVDSTEVVSRD